MKNRWGFLWLIFGLLILSACQGEVAERLWIKAADWSRAQAVGGMGIPDPAPFVVDEAGNIYFLFIDGEFEALQAQVIGLNNEMEPMWSHTFDGILRLPDDPQLFWDGQTLHAFWISNAALVTSRLDSGGNVLAEPSIISGDIRVDSYSAAGDANGNVVAWFAEDQRTSGLYQADISLAQEPLLIDEDGVFPSLRFDNAGALHAVWARATNNNPQVEFLYAAYDDGNYAPGLETIVQEIRVPLTADLAGPTVGIDAENVYIYWLRIFRTGLEAGLTETRYTTFPRGTPDQFSAPLQIYIPVEHDLSYESYPDSPVQVGPRFSLASRPSPNTAVLQDIAPNLNQKGEMVIGARASINYYWRRTANQIGLVYFQDGQPTSYQLLSFTQQPSTDPTVASDGRGNLYASWLETGEVSRFDVFFASTADRVETAYNPVTLNDVVDLSAATIFGLLTGILLAPVAAVLFLILPMFILGLTSIFRRGEQTIRSPGTILSFAIAIIVFQVAKFLALPGMTDYVPFSAWLPFLPDTLQAPLQIIVPLIITIGAILGAWNFTYRHNTDSPLYFMILFVAIDTLFTMAIYGVLFYGAF